MAAAGRYAVPTLLAGVAAGLLGADSGWIGTPVLPALVAAAVAAVLAWLAARRPGAAVCTAGLLLGAAAGVALGPDAAAPVGPSSVDALVGRETVVTGTVLDDPRPRQTRQQLVLGHLVAEASTVRGRLLLWLPRGIEVQAGDRLRVEGSPALAEDFDGFAYREHLARQGIGAVLRAYEAEVVGHEALPVQSLLRPLREALLGGLLATVPEPEAALGAGILLGVRSGIAPDVDDAFATAGLTHVVAISGWNIAIVAGLVGIAVRPLRDRRGGRWPAAGATAVAIAGYVTLTGASPSVVRAGLMAGAMLVAELGGTRTQAASALMLAAVVMLLAAPAVLWDVGFQLSVLATAGLILLGGAVEARLAWLPGWARGPVALTLAAQVTTLPVILLNFERLSLVAPFANVLVAPLVPVVMLVGTLTAVAGALRDAVPLMDAVATVAAAASWLALRLMLTTGIAAAAVPFASLEVGLPAWLAAGYYPLLAAGLAVGRRRASRAGRDPAPASGAARPHPTSAAVHPITLASATALVLLVIGLAGLPDGRLQVATLDVGQGDAILVTAPSGARMLVDGGPDPELTLRRLGEVMPFWERKIEVVMLSHPHEDHVAGLAEVLRRFEVRRIVEPGRPYDNPGYARLLRLAATEPHAVTSRPRTGDVLRLDASTVVQIVYPSADDAAAPLLEGDINNSSIVGVLRCGGFRALLTGDAEAPVEAALARRGVPRVDVLKVAHHGSESSSTPAFLGEVRPRVGLISAGVGNDYGHPRPATLQALAEAGVTVHRTDQEGTIMVSSDGHWMEIRSRRGTRTVALDRPAAGCGPATPRARRGRYDRLVALPDSSRARAILDAKGLPRGVVVHSEGVSRVAAEAARLVAQAGIPVDVRLVEIAALLHDMDKLETRDGPGEHGLVAAAELDRMGHAELAPPVASHPVSCLLDESRFPRGWPSVIVSIADRHVAQRFVTIDERIDDQARRHPQHAASLDAARRPAHALEAELAEVAGLKVAELVERLRAAWQAGP